MMTLLPEDILESVVGGAGTAGTYVKIVNCRDKVAVHSSASDGTANVIGYVRAGERYRFNGWSGSWASVDYNGKKGYVSRNNVLLS